MGLRAQRKAQMRKIKVGDVVTWGLRKLSHPVLEVRPDGVVVDAASAGFPRLFVTWEGGSRGRGSGESPIEKVEPK